jgi:hypothetical protein
MSTEPRKLERHIKSVIDKNETNEISKRLIAKGIDPTQVISSST